MNTADPRHFPFDLGDTELSLGYVRYGTRFYVKKMKFISELAFLLLCPFTLMLCTVRDLPFHAKVASLQS